MPKDIPSQPVELEALITEGEMLIGPELAARILAERVYARQRPLAKADATLWAERLRRGAFQPRRQIWFGLVGGRLHLIDGQHRLSGVVESGIPAIFDVMRLPLDSEADLHEAYICFDRAGRPRSLAEVLNALDIAEAHGLTKTGAREVFRAAILLRFRFEPPFAANDPIAVRDDHERLKYAQTLWPIGAEFERLIRPAPASVRRRLISSQVLAVAMVTLMYQHEQAIVFWGGLAKNDGLRKGDPRNTLLVWLGEHLLDRVGHNGALAASLAWNAFYEHRNVDTLRVGSIGVMRIAGAPLRGPYV